jgi:hypothetical protein
LKTLEKHTYGKNQVNQETMSTLARRKNFPKTKFSIELLTKCVGAQALDHLDNPEEPVPQ